MRFEETFTTCLVKNEGWGLKKRCYIEFTRLKYDLNTCKQHRDNRASIVYAVDVNFQHDSHQKCPRCDWMFSELTLVSSKITDYFSLTVQHLVHLHFTSGMPRFVSSLFHCFKYDQEPVIHKGLRLIEFGVMNAIAFRKIIKKHDKVHESSNGVKFKSKWQAKRLDIFQSPWLIELVALYINLSGSDSFLSNELNDLLSFNLNFTNEDSSLTLILLGYEKLEYSLICPICLDIVFQPYALSCGHIFCKSCACLAANVLITEGFKYASLDSKCPVCRQSGVYNNSVCMSELGFLLQQRRKEEFSERLIEERKVILKQAKEYWELQTSSMMGL